MPTPPPDSLPPERTLLSFRAWRSTPNIMPRAHTHTDLEFNLPVGGDLEYFFAGRFVRVAAGHLVVFWAGIPHRLIARDVDTEYFCLTLPLAWFLSWRIGGGDFAARLLGGEMVLRAASAIEQAQFGGWANDFVSQNPARERIALLEVEASLRRVALESSATAPRVAGQIAGGQAERIATIVGERFRNPELCAKMIADAAGLHPKYALTCFREACGMTLWDYVTRLRVSHAQRLLITTDWGVERVAFESGWASPARFFAAFKTHTGITPRRYRVQGG